VQYIRIHSNPFVTSRNYYVFIYTHTYIDIQCITRRSYRISQSFSTTVILYERKNVIASYDCARVSVYRDAGVEEISFPGWRGRNREKISPNLGANVLRVLILSKNVTFVLKHKWINDCINWASYLLCMLKFDRQSLFTFGVRFALIVLTSNPPTKVLSTLKLIKTAVDEVRNNAEILCMIALYVLARNFYDMDEPQISNRRQRHGCHLRTSVSSEIDQLIDYQYQNYYFLVEFSLKKDHYIWSFCRRFLFETEKRSYACYLYTIVF